MVVMLPGERSNVNTLTRDLQHDRLTSILSQLEPKEILIELPRFQIDYSGDLVNYLKQVSITIKRFCINRRVKYNTIVTFVSYT